VEGGDSPAATSSSTGSEIYSDQNQFDYKEAANNTHPQSGKDLSKLGKEKDFAGLTGWKGTMTVVLGIAFHVCMGPDQPCES